MGIPLIFTRYDLVVEIVMGFLALLLIFYIWISQPAKTKMLGILMMGLGSAPVAIILHTGVLHWTVHYELFNKFWFNVWYCAFGIFYIIILNSLFVYIDYLAYNRREQIKEVKMMCVVFSVIYAIIIFTPAILDKLVVIEDGMLVLTSWELSYVYAGLICCVLCWSTVLFNSGKIARIARIGINTVAPLEILLLLSQFIFRTLVVTSVSYVVPFLLCFLLFHDNIYGEISGFQSYKSIQTVVGKYMRAKKQFVVVAVTFPTLHQRELADIQQALTYSSSKVCRQLEEISPYIRLYERNAYSYFGLCRVFDNREAEQIVASIYEILSTPIKYRDNTFTSVFKMVYFKDLEKFDDEYKLLSFLGDGLKQMGNDDNSDCRELTGDDYVAYIKREKLLGEILDISRKGNLDDERVVPFVQPIKNLKTGTFRTAESLMRLKIDGQMVFPDVFIPMAEASGAIHALTLIMLNKICKQVKMLSEMCDFDAISVNCSTKELESDTFYLEVLNILSMNGVDPSKIRLEITESIEAVNYSKIRENMDILVKEGIQFYLDDFGTGYSNLERISSFPFSTIKFDKSILYKAYEDEQSEELFTLLADYFKSNEFYILVEGVEDEEQRDFVIDKGFEFIQGYFYSKPVPIDDLKVFLDQK